MEGYQWGILIVGILIILVCVIIIEARKRPGDWEITTTTQVIDPEYGPEYRDLVNSIRNVGYELHKLLFWVRIIAIPVLISLILLCVYIIFYFVVRTT